jgi:hypothetical protein
LHVTLLVEWIKALRDAFTYSFAVTQGFQTLRMWGSKLQASHVRLLLCRLQAHVPVHERENSLHPTQ